MRSGRRVLGPFLIAALALAGCRTTGSDASGVAGTESDSSSGLTEASYEAGWQDRLEPLLNGLRESGSLTGHNGTRIAYEIYAPADATASVVLVNGWLDTLLVYRETIYELVRRGYAVYTLDHRGQGLSDRLTSDPRLSHVDDFDDYVADLKAFVDQKVKPAGRPVHMLGHSMGGGIATLYALKHGADLKKLVLSAPMIKVEFGGVPESIIYVTALASSAISGWDGAAPGGDSTAAGEEYTFEKNKFTHSRARFDKQQAILKANPSAVTWSASNGWVVAAIDATAKVRSKAASLVLPTLLFQADEDVMVQNAAQTKLCKVAPKCELVKVPGSYHEVLNETDPVRGPVIERIAAFLAAP